MALRYENGINGTEMGIKKPRSINLVAKCELIFEFLVILVLNLCQVNHVAIVIFELEYSYSSWNIRVR